MTRESLIKQLDLNRQTLLTLLAPVDEALAERPGVVGIWSIKQTLAHIAAWEDWCVQVLQLPVDAQLPPHLHHVLDLGDDTFNAEQVAERSDYTYEEQLDELARVRTELLATLRAAQPADLEAALPAPLRSTRASLAMNSAEHDIEHIDDLRRAIDAAFQQ